ncbi:MAG TPA: hypothetical protein P5136_01640 [Methanofastidiosum sp.]|nr:hypothetical protein [Methanofastidiosum sp.]
MPRRNPINKSELKLIRKPMEISESTAQRNPVGKNESRSARNPALWSESKVQRKLRY